MTMNQTKTKTRAAQLLARLREPSTMAGLSALLLLAGVPPGVPEAVMQGAAAVSALLAVFLPEQGGE